MFPSMPECAGVVDQSPMVMLVELGPFTVNPVKVPTEVMLDKLTVEITVPLDGSVRLVLAPTVKVVVNAPDVVRFPPSVMVLPVLATPVPPYCPATTEAFQVPAVSVPTPVIPV